mmetsp:Transcript_104678/g.213491  ORF Transcript_104678/g.213491 Transcript_104678/m.213491 type:complete len:521 (+) Transcript_104678:661-2223(+)
MLCFVVDRDWWLVVHEQSCPRSGFGIIASAMDAYSLFVGFFVCLMLAAEVPLRGPFDDGEFRRVVEIQVDLGLRDLDRQHVVVVFPAAAMVLVAEGALHALPAELGTRRDGHVFLVDASLGQHVVNHALLVVVFFLALVGGVQMLEVLGLEEVFEDVRSERHQQGEKEGVDVSDGCVLSDGPDGNRADQLDDRPDLDGGPADEADDGNFGALVFVDTTQQEAFPDLVSVEGAHSEIEEQSKETAGGDPGNYGKGAERDKHQEGLSESRPALFLAVGDDLALDTVLVGLDLAGAEGATVEGSLGDQSVARGESQNGAREEGDAQYEEIPVVGGWFLQVELGRLGQDARNVVVDDEEQKEHESGNERPENTAESDALEGVDHPRPVGGGFPVPRRDDVDAFDGIVLVESGDVAKGGGNDNGNQRVVGGQEGSDLSGEENPGFRKVQAPGDVAGDQPDDEGGVSGRSDGRGDFFSVDVLVGEVDGNDQIAEGRVDKGNGNEQLEDLRREGGDLPHQADQTDGG